MMVSKILVQMMSSLVHFSNLLLYKINSTFLPSQNNIQPFQNLLIKLKFFISFVSLQNQLSVELSTSMSIYDLVLINVCHFHDHLTVIQIIAFLQLPIEVLVLLECNEVKFYQKKCSKPLWKKSRLGLPLVPKGFYRFPKVLTDF